MDRIIHFWKQFHLTQISRTEVPDMLALFFFPTVVTAAGVATASCHHEVHGVPQQMARPVRLHGGLLYGPGVGLYLEGSKLMIDCPVTGTIETQQGRWEKLYALVGQEVDSPDAVTEAALKLMSNHERVLRDVTNPVPKSQPELARAARNDAQHVDQALREICRRLLASRHGSEALEERLDARVPGQARAWALTAQYLSKRLQASSNACPGRQPDMSPAASAAFRAVLAEVAAMAMQAWASEAA